MTTPHIIAVSRKETHSFSKQPQASITLIAGEGVEGDAHRGRTVQHLYHVRKDPTAPNRSQVHLFADEMLEELRAKGFDVQPGGLGENILTRGLNLLALPEGTRLHVGEALLEVTGLRTPCKQIDGFRAGLQEHLWGERVDDGKRARRAGVMSVVLVGGVVRPGDAIRVELPAEPHSPLQAV